MAPKRTRHLRPLAGRLSPLDPFRHFKDANTQRRHLHPRLGYLGQDRDLPTQRRESLGVQIPCVREYKLKRGAILLASQQSLVRSMAAAGADDRRRGH
jgi:hypothetical protein